MGGGREEGELCEAEDGGFFRLSGGGRGGGWLCDVGEVVLVDPYNYWATVSSLMLSCFCAAGAHRTFYSESEVT